MFRLQRDSDPHGGLKQQQLTLFDEKRLAFSETAIRTAD